MMWHSSGKPLLLQSSSPECPLDLEIGSRFGKLAAWEVTTRKSQMMVSGVCIGSAAPEALT
jgi:hypothetical protein